MKTISEYEKLPYKTSFNEIKRNSWRHGSGGSTYHKVDGKWPSQLINNALERYLGKNLNKAFSYYCTLVPKYMQKWFLEEFDTIKWNYSNYIVSDSNIIIKKKKPKRRKKQITVYSSDFKEELFILFKKSPKDKSHEVPFRLGRYYTNFMDEPSFYKTTQGYSNTFFEGSKLYNRYEAEQRDFSKKTLREISKIEKEKVYKFLTKGELAIKANDEDILIRDRHGFDESSFLGIEYHGRKRKREKKIKRN